MKTRLMLIALCLIVLTGYTRCGIIDPPENPVFVDLDPALTCLRGEWQSISRNRWEHTSTGDIISNRDYQRIPDVEMTLEPGQCFKIPDCAGADPLLLGHFRTTGFNFVDPRPAVFSATGESRSSVIGARFIYLFEPPNGQQESITEFVEDQEPEDALFLCARDQAEPTPPDASWRGWVTIGQTAEDKIANGEGANQGYALVRYDIDIKASELVCGNGAVEVGEQCDDGNTVDGDGCNNICRTEYPPVCGDNFREGGESCDDGNVADGDGCSSTCSVEPAVCGDGRVWGLEQCDDGNLANGDGCSALCRTETLASCGNGSREPGEQCDDGNQQNGDGCSSACLIEVAPAVCGNNIVELGEQCDGGMDPPTACEYGQLSCQTCTAQCTYRFGDTSICGDGYVDAGYEQCDDGNTVDGDGCDSQCVSEIVPSVCGNGLTEGLEQCDDGNTVTEECAYGDTECIVCSGVCFEVEGATQFCGDGNLNTPFEQCDDGNSVNDDGCSNMCLVPVVSTIEITQAGLTPDVNLLGGDRPRLTPGIDIAAVVQTSETLTEVSATVVGCDPALVSSCTPVSSAPTLVVDQWSVELPDFAAAIEGADYSVDLSVVDASGGDSLLSRQVDFEVYPQDAGLAMQCTKRYDDVSGALYLSFTLTDTGLPINPASSAPYTLADMFDARFLLYQRSDAAGWTLDETDSVRTYFLLVNPVEFMAADNGEYQLIFSGLLGFVDPIQTSIRIDTLGGPRDVCTLIE